MARDPLDDQIRPADPAAVREVLIEAGLIVPVEVSPAAEQVLDLPEFDDTPAGREAFAAAMRALGY